MSQLKKEEKDKLEFKELLSVLHQMILKKLEMPPLKLKKPKSNKLKEKLKRENKKQIIN